MMETEEYLNQLTKTDLEILSAFIEQLITSEVGCEKELMILDAVQDDIQTYIKRWEKNEK